MHKYKGYWYDTPDNQIEEPDLIEAPDAASATTIAYERYNGNPPAKFLYLEEVI